MYLVTASTPSRRGTMILFVNDLLTARMQALSLMHLIAKIEDIPTEGLIQYTPVRWREFLSGLRAYDERITVSVAQTQLDAKRLGVPVLMQARRCPKWSSNKNTDLGRALGIPVRW